MFATFVNELLTDVPSGTYIVTFLFEDAKLSSKSVGFNVNVLLELSEL